MLLQAAGSERARARLLHGLAKLFLSATQTRPPASQPASLTAQQLAARHKILAPVQPRPSTVSFPANLRLFACFCLGRTYRH